MKKYNEDVMVFKAEDFDLIKVEPITFDKLLISKFYDQVNKFYLDRNIAETDESHKQIIPYIVFKDKKGNYLSYTRTKKGGDSRLHNLKSIGIGGHINKKDAGGIYSAILREIDEELSFANLVDYNKSIIQIYRAKALLYDSSNEVGRVHFGLIYFLELESLEGISLSEDKQAKLSIVSLKNMQEEIAQYENWSQIIIKELSK